MLIKACMIFFSACSGCIHFFHVNFSCIDFYLAFHLPPPHPIPPPFHNESFSMPKWANCRTKNSVYLPIPVSGLPSMRRRIACWAWHENFEMSSPNSVVFIILGPSSAGREKGKKTKIGKILASEASPTVVWGGERGGHPFLSPDYVSARFAHRFFFFFS